MSVKELLKKTDSNMIKVKGGTFMMGDVGGIIEGKDEKRATWTVDDDVVHKVTLDSFSMGKYEVTLAEYDVYSKEAGVKFIYDYVRPEKRKKWTQEYAPVENWQRAKDYCLWLAKVSGKNYNLPTEAQWEYAARNGGKRVVFATDDGTYRKGENCDAEQDKPGRFKPSPLGFYDLSGNVREWVNDWYSKRYEAKAVTNPKGPKSGTKKVSRGDAISFVDGTNYSRAGFEKDAPSSAFRCVENY
jgi:formylglycine-generating enzyme required for sulfatase activity